jgi:hypothetical protein
MGEVIIEIKDGQSSFRPLDSLEGTVRWQLSENPERIEVSLFWYTRGKGTRDVGVATSETIENPGAFGSKEFQFKLPAGPYSFSGKLISIIWGVEANCQPDGASDHKEITVSPSGDEVVIQSENESGRGGLLGKLGIR